MLDVTAIMNGIPVEVMLGIGVEIKFPEDILETIQTTGIINHAGKLIVSRGVVGMGANQNDWITIVVGKKIVYEFGSKRD